MKRQQFIWLVMIFCVIAGTLVFFLPGEWFSRYNHHPLYLGVGGYLFALALYLPKVFLKRRKIDQARQEVFLNFHFTLAIGFLVSYLGDLGLYQLYRVGFEYDKLAHFIMPTIISFSFSMVLIVWKKISSLRAITISGLLIFFSGISWELMEFLSDKFLGTQAFGIDGTRIGEDTIKDLLFNISGTILGATVVIYKNKNA